MVLVSMGALLAIWCIAIWIFSADGTRLLPEAKLDATRAVEHVARRTRNLWFSAAAFLVIPALAQTLGIVDLRADYANVMHFAAGASLTPFALAVRAQTALTMSRRADVRILAGLRHVVVACDGRKPVWLRIDPESLSMPRATLVR